VESIDQQARQQPGKLRTKILRHSYCFARFRTLDHGHPVTERIVASEMGRGGYDLVRKVYGWPEAACLRSEQK
jgi:hypothetical protein